MKKIKTIYLIILGVAFILVFDGFKYSLPSDGTAIAIIVNKDNPVASLNSGEVRLYWLRKLKSRWPVINKNIKPVDRKSKCPERQIFYWKVLNMTTDDVETYFVTKQYQNAQKPQDKFSSDHEIIDFVGEEEGAIGFINVNSLTPEAKTKVKVVLTVE